MNSDLFRLVRCDGVTAESLENAKRKKKLGSDGREHQLHQSRVESFVIYTGRTFDVSMSYNFLNKLEILIPSPPHLLLASLHIEKNYIILQDCDCDTPEVQ